MIAFWPSHIKYGTITESISVHCDVMATTLGDTAGYVKLSYTDGISFLPTFLSNGNQK